MDGEWGTPGGVDPAAAALKRELQDIVLWNENHSPRSQQVSIGPSEIGDPCDRKIAYRLAAVPAVNTWSDPWPAIVGTAVHAWLETAINNYQRVHGDQGWRTELTVFPDQFIIGHSDAYNYLHRTVLDHKTSGTEGMRKVRKGILPPSYRSQVHMYGLGHALAGRPVETVALAFFPRSGWLRDLFIWQEPYDETVAKAALARMYGIGQRLIDMNIEANPHRYEQIEATPGDSCVWCPWYRTDLPGDAAASERGCGGR